MLATKAVSIVGSKAGSNNCCSFWLSTRTEYSYLESSSDDDDEDDDDAWEDGDDAWLASAVYLNYNK